MLCADVICSKGKETITAPSTHSAFPTISTNLHHNMTLQNFHLKRPTFLKILCTKHSKGTFLENEENAMMLSMAAARLVSLLLKEVESQRRFQTVGRCKWHLAKEA